MIKSNLGKILEEKKLSINKVSIDTGISRQTLTALANNESKGIQFNTLEILLAYLNVELTDILVDTLNDVLIQIKHVTKDNYTLKIEVENKDSIIPLIEMTIIENNVITLLFLQYSLSMDKEDKVFSIRLFCPDFYTDEQKHSFIKLVDIMKKTSSYTVDRLNLEVASKILDTLFDESRNLEFTKSLVFFWDLPNETEMGILNTVKTDKKLTISADIDSNIKNKFDEKIYLIEDVNIEDFLKE